MEQLEAFVEVARRGSVSRAADALYATQPTLTARLKGLEQELDAKLFIRSQRGMRLTEAGLAFLPYAERTLDTVSSGRRLLAELARGESGQLALGAAPAVSTYVLPGILTRFRRTHPKVSLAVRTGHSEAVLELVLREQVQIGLGRALRHPEVEAIPLYEDELVLVVDPRHSFAEQGEVGPDQLTEVQLILFDQTSSYHRLTSELFEGVGAVPRGVMELDNIDAAKKMVEQGLGVALLPHTAVSAELEAGSLKALTLADTPAPKRHIVIFRRRDAGPPSGVLQAFLNCLSDLRPSLQESAQRALVP
jgi:DNA-binding transcriptional LysR family regulator